MMKLNYVDKGQGHPAIVFIHGFTCNVSSWTEQIPVFYEQYRCVAFDLPGHGLSPDPAQATVEALAAAVNDGLDALELDSVVLVGHSMGCRIASAVHDGSPARVKGIIYVDGSMLATGDANAATSQARENIRRAGSMKKFVRQLHDGFFVDSSPVPARKFVEAGFEDIRFDFAENLWPNLVHWDASRSRDVLKTIRVPVLVIQSTSMNASLQRVSLKPGDTTPWTDAVASSAENVTLRIIENVGHFPMLEAPQACNALMNAFFEQFR